ncbi:hypothetical protein AX14_012976 [Amanita brunnescens Koide BX004]|nr:hypothetical protein AX14_012976 [Amanita brunnescens Koide BX004]
MENETWDEAFNNYDFANKENQIIRNFNIKYECLDARDDFQAQMKAGSAANELPLNCMDDADDIDYTVPDNDPYVNLSAGEFPDEPDTQKVSKSELKHQKEASEIRDVLRRTGWMEEQCNEIPCVKQKHIIPHHNIPAASWKSVLQTKKQEIAQNKFIAPSKLHPTHQEFMPNVVKVMDKAYLEKEYYTTEHNYSIDKICKEYKLNVEQECAFRIIANHAVLPNSEPLKMYIGGMGGTGKTQVLKAVSYFFEKRNEAYRFMIVAPTGSAAALLSGSTYHSAFGINDMSGEAQATKAMTQVRTRLQGIDYIFLDEVSMLSCYDMYKISAQLCKVMNEHTIPFGGLNMLFAGDFAQLPPPIGGENVALYSRIVGKFGTKVKWQEEALGRALWHQVVTVVILWQNMRQKQQSKNDDKMRKALENMRYEDCTFEDIQFLRTQITSQLPGKSSVTDPEFRNVSIITAKNAQKDKINRLGCQRYAQETGQELVDFFSDDALRSADDNKRPNKSRKTADKPVPGKLSLCLGLPVMIKCNVATELCITNGQEATVVGWQAATGKQNQRILDVLFVELKSPPKEVQLEGLPLNVVPLTRSTVSMTCNLPNEINVPLTRSQVEVLPNFAMTDFASQGKTRPYNIVDLNNCRSHQAYYTALSCSSTAKDTVILQGFDTNRITGGASGALRQEFHDLELLDEITKLRFNGKLAKTVHGDRRNALIHTFRQHKGLSYVPSAVHSSIRWNKKDPMLDPIADDMPWTMEIKPISKLDIKSSSDVRDAKSESHDTPIKVTKRKEITPQKEHKTKMSKTHSIHCTGNTDGEAYVDMQTLIPCGTKWHQNSCAYDAILCIVHAMWASNKDKYTQIFNGTNNEILVSLALNFMKHSSRIKTLESTRDDMRRFLHQTAPRNCGWGEFTTVSHVIKYMFTFPADTIIYHYKCKNNHITQAGTPDNTCFISAGATIYRSISKWMTSRIEETQRICITCSEKVTIVTEFAFPLPFIALEFSGHMVELDTTFTVSIGNADVSYKLCGVIYFGDSHFTARVICNNRMVWFHDGIATGQRLIYEGMLDANFSLNQCRGKEAVACIYVKC